MTVRFQVTLFVRFRVSFAFHLLCNQGEDTSSPHIFAIENVLEPVEVLQSWYFCIRILE